MKTTVFEPITDKKTINEIKYFLQRSPRDYLLFLLLTETSIRQADVLRLKIRNAKRDRIIFEDSSGLTEYHLSNDCQTALEEHLVTLPYRNLTDTWLFPTRKHTTHLNHGQARRVFAAAAQAVGLSDLSVENLRATYLYWKYVDQLDGK